MLTCRRATERLSRSFDGPLPAAARIGLEGHMLICRHCRRYRRQMVILDALCREAGQSSPMGSQVHLTDAARGRITAALNEPGGER